MSDLELAIAVAFRAYDAPGTTDREREAILATMASHCSGPQGEAAARILFHLRESRKLQMQLVNFNACASATRIAALFNPNA